MTVLVGGLRVLNTNVGFPQLGVLTKQPETLTNDFFVNLLDMSTEWQKSAVCDHFFEGRDRKTGEVRWLAVEWTLCSVPTRNCEHSRRSMPAKTLSRSS
jgi:catalase-peroxidase